ncbi:peroxiredoxin [Candidatus Peregrinibacteria bacterium RIFOXYB2_FULL_33_20]|nr:MAG: peroxiredoxin [Candidatus Peregrinibacteria bacterium RIFOXYB2_FULL_33_20]
MMQINQKVDEFKTQAYYQGKITDIKLSDYQGKWIVMFFYPADFTFVCPTELEQMALLYEDFKKMKAEVFSVSTDTVFVHKAWHDKSPSINKITFPMLADPSGKISKLFGVYIEDEGLALRGSFIIDPDGILKAYEIHDLDIGRSAEELLRKLQAAQFVREHGGEVCPANWKPGMKTLRPGLDLVGEI